MLSADREIFIGLYLSADYQRAMWHKNIKAIYKEVFKKDRADTLFLKLQKS